MTVDYLIIGQGISGTWLSYYLQKENKSFIVIDDNFKFAPSRVAAGVINPVTGRRHVEVWMADTIIPFARTAYEQFGRELDIVAIRQNNIIDFFPSPQMKLSFTQRVNENNNYLSACTDDQQFSQSFQYDFGCGQINPVYTVALETILPAWREKLRAEEKIIEDEFDIQELHVAEDHIRYKNIRASKIIFCDGTASAANQYFDLLPFAPNKGEALILDIPALDPSFIYKKSMTLVPLAANGQWWIGSSYAWQFENTEQTPEFLEKTKAMLEHWLKIPFTILDHIAAVRPATLERRPFVGLHPVHNAVAILNGMGTKGCSLAPFFAQQLARQLCYNAPVHPEADVQRFKRVLSRKISR